MHQSLGWWTTQDDVTYSVLTSLSFKNLILLVLCVLVYARKGCSLRGLQRDIYIRSGGNHMYNKTPIGLNPYPFFMLPHYFF